MKKLISLGKFTAIIITLGFLALQFTSCSKDDSKPQNIYYNMGFTSLNSSGDSFITEMKVIENAFRKELNVSDNLFNVTGKVDECDAQVKAACVRAEEKLKTNKWTFDGEFQVSRVQSDPVVVYSYHIVK